MTFFEVNVWSTAKFDLQKKIIMRKQNNSKYCRSAMCICGCKSAKSYCKLADLRLWNTSCTFAEFAVAELSLNLQCPALDETMLCPKPVKVILALSSIKHILSKNPFDVTLTFAPVSRVNAILCFAKSLSAAIKCLVIFQCKPDDEREPILKYSLSLSGHQPFLYAGHLGTKENFGRLL